MSQDKKSLSISKPSDTGALVAWLQDVSRQVRLTWRLFWDQRVPLWTKLIPPVALTYVLFPVDFIPDVALGLGQLDDIAVLLLGAKLFIELAPPDVVREHLTALGARIQEWHVVEGEDEADSQSVVIEGEYQLQDSGAQASEAEAE